MGLAGQWTEKGFIAALLLPSFLHWIKTPRATCALRSVLLFAQPLGQEPAGSEPFHVSLAQAEGPKNY